MSHTKSEVRVPSKSNVVQCSQRVRARMPNRRWICYAAPLAGFHGEVPSSLAHCGALRQDWRRASSCILRPLPPALTGSALWYACSSESPEKNNGMKAKDQPPGAAPKPVRSSLKPPPVRRVRVPDSASGAGEGTGQNVGSGRTGGVKDADNDSGYGIGGTFSGSGGARENTSGRRRAVGESNWSEVDPQVLRQREQGKVLSRFEAKGQEAGSDNRKWGRENMSLEECVERVVEAIDTRAREEKAGVEPGVLGDTEEVGEAAGQKSIEESDHRLNSEPIEGGEVADEVPRDELIRLEGKECDRCGDTLLARELYRRCVELEPSNGKGWQDLAKAEGRIRGGLKKSASVLRRALSMNPENAYLWQSLGFLECRMGKYDDARATFEDGIAVDRKHAPLYSTWGRMEGMLGNHAEARELFERGSEADPSCARLYYTWGVMERKVGNVSRANDLFQKGLDIEPNNAFIWQSLGAVAVEGAEFDRARTCFQNALVDDPENVVVLDHWGRLESRLGNCNAAEELFRRGVASSPVDTRVLQGWSLMELQRGDVESARRLVKRAVAINHRDSILWDQFAKIEMAFENYPRARALFKRATEVGPQDWKVWDNWSAMEFHLGNLEESAALLKRSFAIRFKASGEFTILANNIEDKHDHNSQPSK